MLGENVFHLGRGISTNYHPDYNLISEQVMKIIFNKVDAVFYNFEYGLINDIKNYSKDEHRLAYLGYIDSIRLFPQKILKIVNVANNHFSQYKQVSIFTKSVLKENGFLLIGSDNKPLVLEISNQKIFFWGVSLVRDIYFSNEYFNSSYKDLLNNLKLPTKQKGQAWIISIHWGDEYIQHPSAEQIDLGHSLIDIGFDFIIGHHPHVIQPIEVYKDKLISYSLGNFIFDQNFSFRTQRGLGLNVYLNDGIKIKSVYKTYQKAFRINKAKILSEEFRSIKYLRYYKYYLLLIRTLMRLLMKIEVLIHFKSLSVETLEYIKQKALNKIKTEVSPDIK